MEIQRVLGWSFAFKGRVLEVILEDEKRGDTDGKVNVF